MKFISNLCKLNIMIVKSKKIEQDINMKIFITCL